KNWRR
ncbi:hypothetical protein EC990672_3139C, partial [Escherichia coli 99.0672]